MRVGVSMRSGYGVDDVRVGARWMAERAAAAWEAGLDSLFVGDHHVTGSPYYQNSPMLGRLLAEWGDRTCGALYLLPLWNPVLVAEQVGTLAAIAEGRFVLQVGLGAGEAQFAGMGAELRTRRSRFEVGLDIVRRLLAGEEVTAEGPSGPTEREAQNPWAITGARIGPLPPEPVDVWIGAGAPAAIDRAARLGDGWIAWPGITVAEATEQLQLYRERCAAHDRPVGATVIRREVHVGADDAEARRVVEPVLAKGHRGFPEEALIIGGIDTVVDQFRELATLGFSDVLVRHVAEDQHDVIPSLGRLGVVRDRLGA